VLVEQLADAASSVGAGRAEPETDDDDDPNLDRRMPA